VEGCEIWQHPGVPTTVVIPQHTEIHCAPCPYHKIVACSLDGDSQNFVEWGCTHQNSLVVAKKAAGYSVWELGERTRDSKIGHRLIGRTELAPNWCPLDSTTVEKNLPPLKPQADGVEFRVG
jgi:hypothetical protein